MTEIVIVIVAKIETEIVTVITTVETEAETGEDGEVVMVMMTMTAMAVLLGMVVEQQSHLLQLLWRSQVYKTP